MLDRFQGCLIGLAVGDALGAPVEGLPAAMAEAQRTRLTEMPGDELRGLAPGSTTDDTAMALCIARSIVERGRFDAADAARRFLDWFDAGAFGIGRTTFIALAEMKRGASWEQAGRIAHQKLGGQSAGNGSIMRCAPVGLLHYRRPERLVEDSRTSSIITHWDERAQWGAAALNLALAEVLQGRREGLEGRVADVVAHPLVAQAVRRAATAGRQELRNTAYVLDTLTAAMWCFQHTDSFEDAVLDSVALGGDTDTQGAVTGTLAGAYYGRRAIPPRWQSALAEQEELAELAQRLLELADAE